MTASDVDRHPVEELAEDFLERLRRGERPPLSEYTAAHPDLAHEIRELFPALVVLEEARPRQGGGGLSAALVTSDGRRLERIGDYRIIRELGRGGLGVVYEADHETLGRHVALKVLPLAATDPRQLLRFRREARAAARLHHTNIVPVYDVGQRDGVHYYAMQFILGQGLDEVMVEVARQRRSGRSREIRGQAPPQPSHAADLARSMLTGQFCCGVPGGDGVSTDGNPCAESDPEPAELAALELSHSPDTSHDDLSLAVTPSSTPPAARGDSVISDRSTFSAKSDYHYYRSVGRIGLQVAEALAYAHDQRVVHRDIKPSNLLLDARGTVWVTDFGLAKEAGDDLTATGDVFGTLRYMAPERFGGVSDPRSDIYGLGLTIYELLTLQPAFREHDPARLAQSIREEGPCPPRKLDPRVPSDLETIVLKMIARDMTVRYASAHEAADDFRRYLSDRPIRARRVTALESAWRWCRRNPVMSGLMAAVALLLLIVGVGTAFAMSVRAERDRATAAENRALVLERESAIRSHLSQAVAHRRSGLPGGRGKALAEIKKAVALDPTGALRDELRQEAISALALTDVRFDEPWRGYPAPTGGLAFDREYERYAYRDPEGNIQVCRAGDHRPLARLAVPEQLAATSVALDFNVQGNFLAACNDAGRLQVWDLAEQRAFFAEPLAGRQRHDISSDNSRLAVACRDRTLVLFELASQSNARQIGKLALGRQPQSVAFSPTGDRLALGFNRPAAVEIREPNSTTTLAAWVVSDDPLDSVEYLNWHPGGRNLALSLGNGNRAEIWDASRGQRVAKLEGHRSHVASARYSPSGRLLATSGWDGTARIWDASSAQALVVLSGVQLMRWSGDGRIVGLQVADDGLVPVILDGGGIVRSLASGSAMLVPTAFDQDSRLLAASTTEGVTVWDLASKQQAARLELGLTPLVSFNDEGNELLTGGVAGVARWPVQRTSVNNVRIGPPLVTSLASASEGETLNSGRATPDHKRAVLTVSGQVYVYGEDNSLARTINVPPGHDHPALSPDGAWVATVGWHDPDVLIWSTNSGQCVGKLDLGAQTFVSFTPDSKYLITSRHDQYCFWDVHTWQPARRIPRLQCPFPGHVAFTPDGRTMALELTFGVVHLVDYATGRTWARLEDPRHNRAMGLQFSPSGMLLAVLSGESFALHVWDLRLIQERLSELALGWDSPGELSAGTESSARSTAPVDIDVDYGSLNEFAHTQPLRRQTEQLFRQAQLQIRLGRWKEAIAIHERFVAAQPASAMAHNSLAWMLVTCPDQSLRNIQRGLELARLACQREPSNAMYLNTLGVAYYRAGQWRQAVEELNRSETAGPGESFGYNAFFLAMAHWQLGEQEESRRWYDQAVAWLQTAPASFDLDELGRFQAEARRLLEGGSGS